MLLLVHQQSGSAGAEPTGEEPSRHRWDTFAFSPTICTRERLLRHPSVNIAAVAGRKALVRRGPHQSHRHSRRGHMIAARRRLVARLHRRWTLESIVHVVAMSAAGTVLDINGNGTSWVATDLEPRAEDGSRTGSRRPAALLDQLRAGDLLGTTFGLSATPNQLTNQVHPAMRSGLSSKTGCTVMTQRFLAFVAAAIGQEAAVLRAEIATAPLVRAGPDSAAPTPPPGISRSN